MMLTGPDVSMGTWCSGMTSLWRTRFLAVGEDPSVSTVQYQAHQRQIISTKATRLLPDVTVAIEANDRNVVTLPDRVVFAKSAL